MNQVLIIGFVWPEPKSSAAGSRMLQLINALQANNYSITFASPCVNTDNAFNLDSIGITQKDIQLNDSSFDEFIKELKPDVVIFDRFMIEEQFGWRVSEHCPKAIRILDTEDLHCLRKGRQQAFKDGKIFNKSYLFRDIAKREIASIYRCDLSLIISETELDILKNDFKVDVSLLLYLPFMIDEVLSETIETLPTFSNRKDFITIGNFLHEPNYNAVLYLKETIWPLIRTKLPKAVLNIYGAYSSQKVLQLQNENEGFLIKGFAEDVNEVMKNARICLVPLRFGAGLKGKLIDAMINGTPSVITSIAAEGMFGHFKPNGFIEDNPKVFVENAFNLYNDESLWHKKQQNGFELINNRFNNKIFNQKFISRIESITSNIKKHRLNNFTGGMLQFHTLQSTKYMSRWIEEKNKN